MSKTAPKKDKENRSLPKAPTGIQGLDEITEGGFPRGRPTLICGSAGAGKTLLAMEFLVRGAMEEWAGYAAQGREALLSSDVGALGKLIDANFDLRAKIYTISHGNLEMIQTARAAGATSNFSGSGGAVTGTFEDDRMFRKLEQLYAPLGIKVIRPKVNP